MSGNEPAFLNRQPKWIKRIFYGIIVVMILFVLFVLTPPLVLRSVVKSPHATVMSNLGQIFYPLIGFDEEYGSFPNNETAALVQDRHPTDIDLSGSSSNALSRQLFDAQCTEEEVIFYAKVSGARKPDGYTSRGHLLE
jgi:hypothetical protein